ncbi:S8 family serine peptidase [Sedimentisphaera salicampi]|uniref:S8 family serine peptidase n=1 Tax=Sedimentisphaera salicampi TaxID=1941349 RepID=UPI000B9A55BC|nr:S8 family serine peptidase [Sedimentisphaera salicampi]OXU15906.1 Intracellular serine protease [Sedimentisphaera salicampi]
MTNSAMKSLCLLILFASGVLSTEFSYAASDLAPYLPDNWLEEIPVGYQQLSDSENHTSNPFYTSGTDLYYNMAVKNEGSSMAGDFSVRIVLEGPETNSWIFDLSVWPFFSGETFSFYTDKYLGSLQPGAYTISVEIDYYDEVQESDETNNYFERIISVGQGGYSSISGNIFTDFNFNASKDAGETGPQGWTVYSDTNFNGTFDSNEPNDVTDSSGNYTLTELKAGSHLISAISQSGWLQTYPYELSPLQPQQMGAAPLPSEDCTTKGSEAPLFKMGQTDGEIRPDMIETNDLIGMSDFRNDYNFDGYSGQGYAVAVIDTGIDVDHSFFGPDLDNNGVADRIVYQYDFAENDSSAADYDGHGTHVTSIIAGEDDTYPGIAPVADIIALKVFDDEGNATFGYVEEALQWVVNNASAYNIASVNISLGDGENNDSFTAGYGLNDEFSALAEMGVASFCSAGNSYIDHAPDEGCSYPASDLNTMSVGAVFDDDIGYMSYSGGATAFSTDADRITPFSLRHHQISCLMAPGAKITAAGNSGNILTMSGTSQASPILAGVSVIAQQISEDLRGTKLTFPQLREIIKATAQNIYDGDDENDNVQNTYEYYKRVNAYSLAEGLVQISDVNKNYVDIYAGEAKTGVDFGFYELTPDLNSDGAVNESDLSIFASCWLETPEEDCLKTDLDESGFVDYIDFIYLADFWGI